MRDGLLYGSLCGNKNKYVLPQSRDWLCMKTTVTHALYSTTADSTHNLWDMEIFSMDCLRMSILKTGVDFRKKLKSNVNGKETHMNNEAISLYDIAPTSFHNPESQEGMSYECEIPQM